MKKVVLSLVSLVLVLTLLVGCSGSKDSETITIAVPNDTTNEARALLLLEENGYIKLKEGAGIQATVNDIEENPLNIEFKEVEAAQVPSILEDVDYAIINSNYAIQADLSPTKDSLIVEDSSSDYSNLVGVKSDRVNEDIIKALKAACESEKVQDYINEKYDGEIIGVVDNPGDGYDQSIDYDALAGQTIKIGASPTPHGEILEVVKEILSKKDITLEIQEYTDYVQPNTAVDSGDIDANFFQHEPYLIDFNEENGTDITPITFVHVEPMGLYGGKVKTLDKLDK